MRSLLAIALLLAPEFLHAQTPQQVRVSLNHATVFLNGAELASTSKITLPQGETDILFTNIAGSVNQQSLSIGADNNVVVQSATFQNNYLNPADSLLTPQGKILKDSITALGLRKALLEDKQKVIAQQLSLFESNKMVAGANTGLSVAELQKLLDLTAARMAPLLAEQRSQSAQLLQLDERIGRLSQQLDAERRKDFQPGGQLLVKFYAPRSTTSAITMSYVVPNAGWTPAYDLRVEKVNDPVQLFYKANVYQNSGVKWDNVSLSLSTGNPNESAEAPVLNPWALSFETPQYYGMDNNKIQLNRAQQSRTMTSEEIEKLPTINASDAASLGSGVYQAGNTAGLSLNKHTLVDNSGINTSFDIDLPYTIPSDGQTHTVAIKDYHLSATYRYFTVPKLDRDAFLQAQITDWEDLSLLPAQTNVFFEGSYVGQGYIDMRNVRDTMNLSLGRDKKIIIRRERDKNFQSEKTIGTNQRQSFAYTISVRNTRKEPVKLVVLEQFPISSNDDIVIENQEAPDAVVDKVTGAVRWTLNVKPADLVKLRLSYTVKYPRDKTIGNLR